MTTSPSTSSFNANDATTNKLIYCYDKNSVWFTRLHLIKTAGKFTIDVVKILNLFVSLLQMCILWLFYLRDINIIPYYFLWHAWRHNEKIENLFSNLHKNKILYARKKSKNLGSVTFSYWFMLFAFSPHL